ncbi:restriction endonuclease [Paenibacillus polymyxa]|uniref:restriction endonuclease n=1 Tax=Paenibacillus polymyxa TaxID=1406 RepID=UPI00234B552D|nr:restriction endonuclease [Paenibacillus polymyxa]WCM59885.1 restriction endonuclease [Paenibacillus polymyxa]
MPSENMMRIPKTKSPEEFEKICQDVLEHIYKRQFELYGRKGQKQDGIDLISFSEKDVFVAQCKNYISNSDSNALIEKIKKDIDSAKKEELKISKFVVMTATDRDAKVQSAIFNIQCDFKIEVKFWDEIEEVICKKIYILKKYYPNLIIDEKIKKEKLNKAIKHLNNIKSISNLFNELAKVYQVAHDESNDIQIYNACVTMWNSVNKLKNFKSNWNLQLEKINADKVIEHISKDMPEFYDAQSSGGAANLIVSIQSYLDFFRIEENMINKVESCDTAIKLLKEYSERD